MTYLRHLWRFFAPDDGTTPNPMDAEAIRYWQDEGI